MKVLLDENISYRLIKKIQHLFEEKITVFYQDAHLGCLEITV
jgi:hypothetical protein